VVHYISAKKECRVAMGGEEQDFWMDSLLLKE